MKLKIWQDENGRRHTSIDGIEVPITGLDMKNRPGHPSEITLYLVSEMVELEVDANVELVVNNDKYRLNSIRKAD